MGLYIPLSFLLEKGLVVTIAIEPSYMRDAATAPYCVHWQVPIAEG